MTESERARRPDVEVFPDLCASTGYCVRLAPDVFELDDRGRVSVRTGAGHIRASDDGTLRDAETTCPSGAIRVIETRGDGDVRST